LITATLKSREHELGIIPGHKKLQKKKKIQGKGNSSLITQPQPGAGKTQLWELPTVPNPKQAAEAGLG